MPETRQGGCPFVLCFARYAPPSGFAGTVGWAAGGVAADPADRARGAEEPAIPILSLGAQYQADRLSDFQSLSADHLPAGGTPHQSPIVGDLEVYRCTQVTPEGTPEGGPGNGGVDSNYVFSFGGLRLGYT
jgi:hypothetical protein